MLYTSPPDTFQAVATAADLGSDAALTRLMLHFEISEGRRSGSWIGDFPYWIRRLAGPSGMGRSRALLDTDAVWGISSEHPQLLRFDELSRVLWASNLVARTNETGLVVGGQLQHLAAGAFERAVATPTFDRSEPLAHLSNPRQAGQGLRYRHADLVPRALVLEHSNSVHCLAVYLSQEKTRRGGFFAGNVLLNWASHDPAHSRRGDTNATCHDSSSGQV